MFATNLTLTFAMLVVALVTLTGSLLLRQRHLTQRIQELERQLRNSRHSMERRPRTPVTVGKRLPEWRLFDADGKPRHLDDLSGRRRLLLFWDPAHPICVLMAHALARIDFALADVGCRLIVVTPRESANGTARHSDLRATTLYLDVGLSIAALLGADPPAAYLLDDQLTVLSPLAIGASQVMVLARDATDGLGLSSEVETNTPRGNVSLSRSRIEREGIRPGTDAPPFELPDIRGGSVSLENYRGRKLLLVFSDPHCGPCNALAPDLASLARRAAGSNLDLLIVGRGDLEENRRKADELALGGVTVAVQRRWEVSLRYGIFATPVAFLIDEHGHVANPVAKGVYQILNLAEEAIASVTEVNHAT